MRYALYLMVLIILYGMNARSADLPNGTLEVAYRQKQDGKLSESVHNLTLTCWSGSCTLTVLSLNQCMNGITYPKVDISDMRDGGLKVSMSGRDKLIVEDTSIAGTRFLYQFGFTTRPPFPDLVKLGATGRLFDELTSFSGSAIKESAILDRIISWELIPLDGQNVTVAPLCSFFLNGLPKHDQPSPRPPLRLLDDDK